MLPTDSATSKSKLLHQRVVKTPGICGGNARIAGTRMAVWNLSASRQEGCSDERFLELYSWLTRDDLQAAWQYVESHQDEIQQLIEDNLNP